MSTLEDTTLRLINGGSEAPLDLNPKRPAAPDKTFAGMGRWVGEMYRTAKRNAERRSIPFTLSRREFRAMVLRSKGRCMMTGIEFEFEAFEGSCRRPFAPSLDRIDSSQGYSLNNCRLVCVIVNLAMNQWGIEPLMKVAENLIARKGEIQERELRRGKYEPVGFETVSQFLVRVGADINPVRLASHAGRMCRRRGIASINIPNIRSDGSAGFGGVQAYPTAFLHEALGALKK